MATKRSRAEFILGHANEVNIREALYRLPISVFRSLVAYDKPADHDPNGAPVSLSMTTTVKNANGKPVSFSSAINGELFAVMEDRLRGNTMEYVEGGNAAVPKGNQQLLPAFKEVDAESKIFLYCFSAEDENGDFSVTDKDGKPIFFNYTLAFDGKFDLMSDAAADDLMDRIEAIEQKIAAKTVKATAKTTKQVVEEAAPDGEPF